MPTAVNGVSLSGFVYKGGQPPANVYAERDNFVKIVAPTDASGYYYTIWVPLINDQDVYVFASLNSEIDILPVSTEFTPIYEWFHHFGYETKELNFSLQD